MKKILISGGAGFIGSNLAIALIRKGYFVTVLDNLSPQIHSDNPENSFLFNSISDKVNFIQGDVRNRDNWEKSLSGQDAVIHLAAETGTGQSMYQIYKYCEVNTGGTALLLDILANKKNAIQKVIVASSRAIYGEGRYHCQLHGEVYPDSRNEEDLEKGIFECKCPKCGGKIELLSTHEEAKIQPQSIYGISKYNQEELILVGGKSLNIPAVAFRYQNVYGPGQSLSNPYTGILSIFSTQIKNNNSINIFEDGKESRDFVYIDDVVNATILGLEKEQANYNSYNVGSGNNISVLQIANKLVKLYNSGVAINVTGNFRIGDIRHNYADLNKIKQDLNFEPETQFDEGITNFVKWVNTQKKSEDLYSNSIYELKERGLYK
ncbi:NAD-dependent epimerase/dehydratase family protein [Hanamia caeni]|jgi:dTDP-L-rhamnose 4-epimerase|uniref:NAD-dependent epimerase/dehydratase family protein n=1 Tax=Hanamia caeni TaxID=2294116 RepID=A0A3M9NI36_9BACT|nr:NAD-dependent epimerase/dehydratase family protein [Hanamia caeni]RNI37479.1 NAD-dependent epimerase/dehydratase family protein [Hanamia caeni]